MKRRIEITYSVAGKPVYTKTKVFSWYMRVMLRSDIRYVKKYNKPFGPISYQIVKEK